MYYHPVESQKDEEAQVLLKRHGLKLLQPL